MATTESPEQIAKAFLRPYREKWVAPYDIMQLPPTDCQGCYIEIRGEMLLLTHQGEAHAFSLKKLIVQVEKELDRVPEKMVATPRDLARLLIRTSVERGEEIHHLAYSYQGMGWYGYNVSIGGYLKLPGKKQAQSIDCWHIVVNEFEGEPCAQIFVLREIYQEIERELKQGYTVVQPVLFSMTEDTQ